MRNIFLLLFLIVTVFVSWGNGFDSQNDSLSGYEYDEFYHIFWLSEDSIYLDDDAPFKTEELPIYVTLTSYGAAIIVYNNSDEVIFVKWSDIVIKGNEQYMGSSLIFLTPERRINYTSNDQTQYIAKGDNSVASLDSKYGHIIIDEKNLKKLYKKNKKEIPIRYVIEIPIICNDKRYNYVIVRKGLYKGGK